MQFRKDINGLRAIAVIAVVLFHFNASWVSGGFAGVDVFFVISGFLMTGIIFRGIEQENFSILKFYVARANRIIPSLAVLCLALLIFGWLNLSPLDYRALGKHVASSIGFLSNIIYWRESGYFDAASHEKWLLHTWSLSAEWQFYIIYPLVLVAMRKFMSVKAMKQTILFGTFLGIILCVIATSKWSNAAYFLLPTRAWEMMIGGIAYLYPIDLKDDRKKILEWFGLALIVGSYFLISKENSWPGYLAMFPVLGSFLIIQAQRNDSFITSNIISQKIGAWSYSIYLWHWPLVVAIYYFSLNNTFVYIGIALSVLFGFLSNKYIEKIKFRKNFGNLFSYLKCKPLCLAFVGFIFSIAVIYKTNCFYNMPDDIYHAVVINSKTNGNDIYTWNLVEELDKKKKFKDVKYKVLTIGDSQSGDFINSLYEIKLSNKVDLVSRIIQARCEVFHLDKSNLYKSFRINENIINGYISKEHCEEQIQRILEDNIVEEANIIIVSMLWKDKNMPYIMKSIENIRKRNKKATIYIVGGKSFNISVQEIIYRSYYKDQAPVIFAFSEIANNKDIKINFQNKAFIKNQNNLNFHYINMMNIICVTAKCKILNENNIPLYYDATHTTRAGAKYIGLEVKKLNIFPSDFYL